MVVAAAATAVAVAHTLVFWLNRNSQVALPSPYLLKSQDLAERILSLEADLNRQSENTLKEKEEHEKTRTELEVKEKQLEEERQNHTLTVQRHGEELERQSREFERQREELERQGRELKMKDGKLNRMKTLTIVYEKFRQWIEDEASNSSSGFTEFNHSEVDDSIPKDQKYHLGKGGYGIVYQAELRGTTVAMKILDKSSWQGEREFKQEEYMGANGNESNFNPERCNPETMEGYKYFVYGESQKSRMNGHSLSVKDLRTPITLDKIWQCECDDDMLLSSIKRQGKDLSLSFALSRLLRCRLEGAKLHADTVSMTRKLISKRILAEDPENEQLGIRILELDVEFLRDSLHTSYPMVFCSGFLSLSFTILACLVKFLVVLWLYKDISKCPTMFMRSFGFCSTMFKWEMTPFIKGRNPNESVKARVIQALRSMDLEGHPLSKDLPSPRLSVRAERYWLASVADVPRCSRVILVWHIATCLCEIKFANDSFTGCCLKWMSMLPSTEVDETDDELDKSYAVTYYLSRYCMHLLVSKRKLLPEDILVSKKTLQDTVQCAREMLKGCNSFQSVYDKLMEEPQKALVPDAHDMNLSGNILQQGAIMANALIVNEEDEACRWEILAEVWAHLIVHIAPSSRIEAHAENLKSGSEFITVIWALFSHCGIEKSELWQ
ncbi:hypothetical protein OsI_36839 [Oryza sativa Indica Group]|uniref:DUF4220 domain-containing protein n=1 Tax=Oryza sativa subsp. indica TaxID=39946 RepID=A2ZGD7_ORYSI|nr:hypothetical protein OsI_36839 [Oryza sativa Indica Group]